MPFDWPFLAYWLHAAAAVAHTVLAIWLWQRGETGVLPRRLTLLALGLTAFFHLVCALQGATSPMALFAEVLRNLAWLLLMLRLFAPFGKGSVGQAVRAVYAVLGLVLAAQPVIGILPALLPLEWQSVQLIFYSMIVFRMMFAVGGLMLVHNLYTAAGRDGRVVLQRPLLALALMWFYDLNSATVAYLTGSLSVELAALDGGIGLIIALLMALSTGQRAHLRFQPSRSLAFETLSLVGIGTYLILMVLLAKALRWMGGDYGQLAQITVLVGMGALALMLLPSERWRAWLRVKLSKHMFQHRYDYRSEWMRFTSTIGRPDTDSGSFDKRVVQAVADIAESPAGLLLTPDDTGALVLAERWNWPTADVPAMAMSADAMQRFQHSGFIVDLDDLRSGKDPSAIGALIPEWMWVETRVWALVPLIHFDRLTGLVVLARPQVSRSLDWEDFDLLRVVGRQLASYQAEQASQQALLEAARFDEFNRRMAFVMHDIKNLASQLGLVARNAERHAGNPEFQADMLKTIRNSVDKLNGLLSRLSRYRPAATDALQPVPVARVVQGLLNERADAQRIRLIAPGELVVQGQHDAVEQVIRHLVQNAIDASPADQPVTVKFFADGLFGCIEIIDTGCGMSAEFVRTQLFKPFVSSKTDGFGIGAFEARELVARMGGRIEVESREGIGSRFVVRLPLSTSAAVELTDNIPQTRSA